MANVKKHVADGKALVASALTQAGANTESNASFETMAQNVANARPKQTVWTTSGVNMKDYFPSTWDKLRTNDFIAGVTGAWANCSWDRGHGNGDASCGASASISYNYDYTNGILTFSSKNGYAHGAESMDFNTYVAGLFCAWRGTYSG